MIASGSSPAAMRALDGVERALLVERRDAGGERRRVEAFELGHRRFLLAPVSPPGAGAPTLARNENRSPRQMKQPQLIGFSS